MFVRSQKGEELMHSVDQSRFAWQAANMELAMKGNPMFCKSKEKEASFARFEEDFKEKGLHYAVMHSPGAMELAKRKLKRVVATVLHKK